MGKNRKPQQVVNQDLQKSGSEDEDVCSEEIPVSFLTSDNFCLVQKKKNSRRSEDQGNIRRLPRSRSNSGKIILNDEANSLLSNGRKTGHHTSFWTRSKQDTCRNVEEIPGFSLGEGDTVNITANDLNSVSGLCELTQLIDDEKTKHCASSDVVKDSSNLQDGASQMDTFCFNYDDVLSELGNAKTGFELLRSNESPEESFANQLSEDEKGVHYSDDADSNSFISVLDANHSKSLKKTKRKERKKKKAVDDDIEALLLELECSGEGSGKVKACNRNANFADSALQSSFIPNIVEDTADSEAAKESKSLKEKELSSISVFSAVAAVDTNACLCHEKLESSETVERKNQIGNEDVSTRQDFTVHSGHSIKTTSQKKKDKKIREKQERLEKWETNTSKKTCECSDTVVKVDCSRQDTDVSDTLTVEEVNEKNKLREIEKKDRKRPSKKQLAAIQEALKKAKEEEERLKKAEEARQKAAEEAEKLRQEKLRLEQEKKEKKKLKEKQRREKLKAEGRLLSKSQKQSRARMEATLAALRQQGINIPEIGEKKPHGPRLGNYKPTRKRVDSTQSSQSSDSQISQERQKSERQKSESLSSQESYGKESDLPSSYDSQTSWDSLHAEAVLTTESEECHLSCSDESDSEENCPPSNCVLTQDLCNIKLKTPLASLGNITMDFSSGTKSQRCTVECEGTRNEVKLRSPVVCVLGHVDTGKTKILDYIRKTHVQDAEAGGITQQIGATMIPRDAIKEKCKMVKDFPSFELKIPGLLVIDTPGHESFSNLRSRGSSVCDIAILVVDIMHGLEAQTLESINLLKKGKTPFVVALNKIDRIYGWKSVKNDDIENVIKSQTQCVQMEIRKRCQEIILQFANECLNAALFYENKDPRSFVSMIPTSAITGDGMGNVLSLVAKLTQTLMFKKLIFSEELKATVLEVKAISGLGTTIDVILVNGHLQEGDTIVLAGHDGPVVTQIRSLLMPHPLRELRVKNPYMEYKTIEGAQGVKITGKDLDKAIAGLPLFVAQNHNKIDILKEEINYLFRDRINSIKTSERGVYVQASTLGSLEALLEYLSASEVPYFGVKIGPVVKKDVMKASIMLEHDSQYAVILAFDVKIERDAQELADSLGVQIFHADIIYHLCDKYMKYREELQMRKREEIKRLAVYPCKLKILPHFIFSMKDPIVLGVSVEAGTLKEGTPLCVPAKDNLEIGTVSTIEVNNKIVDCAKRGQEVCIKIEPKSNDSPKVYGKHFDHEHLLVSRITRQSIDICKEHFRDDLDSSDWHLIVELKKMLHIA
ncbi:Eukaryotic translation initiation factor 5B, partial [Stegodyphus mimosarum]